SPEPAVAKKSTGQNGRDRLEDAIGTLIQNQTTFLSRASETDRAHAEIERRRLQYEREAGERFARIEAQMTEIIRVLKEHGRVLERLPDAVRDKIGFKPPS